MEHLEAGPIRLSRGGVLVRTGQGRVTEGDLGRLNMAVTVHDTLSAAVDYLLLEALR